MKRIKRIISSESFRGATRKVASPESMTLGPWLWVPGSPLRGAPE